MSDSARLFFNILTLPPDGLPSGFYPDLSPVSGGGSGCLILNGNPDAGRYCFRGVQDCPGTLSGESRPVLLGQFERGCEMLPEVLSGGLSVVDKILSEGGEKGAETFVEREIRVEFVLNNIQKY